MVGCLLSSRSGDFDWLGGCKVFLRLIAYNLLLLHFEHQVDFEVANEESLDGVLDTKIHQQNAVVFFAQ